MPEDTNLQIKEAPWTQTRFLKEPYHHVLKENCKTSKLQKNHKSSQRDKITKNADWAESTGESQKTPESYTLGDKQ